MKGSPVTYYALKFYNLQQAYLSISTQLNSLEPLPLLLISKENDIILHRHTQTVDVLGHTEEEKHFSVDSMHQHN